MRKLRKNGGFTLIEMLIVVAIIAILVAISIPLINAALERARDATDEANERAAKAEATIIYMGVVPDPTDSTYQTLLTNLTTAGTGVYYDAADGNLMSSETGIVAYGQCTGNHTGNYENIGDHRGYIIRIEIDPTAAGIDVDESMFTIAWDTQGQ